MPEFPITLPSPLGLNSLIDVNLEPPVELEVTQAMIDQFGTLTMDRQWIHVDADAAAASPFGTTVAQGFLTLSLITFFVTHTVRVEGVRLGLACGVERARFLNPVTAGSKIAARCRLKSVREFSDCVQATWAVALVLRDRVVPSCIAEWTVRYYS
jgi:acyl dehydratase